MKKMICLLGLLVLLLAALTVSAAAASTNDLLYTVNNGKVTITGVDEDADGVLIIPSTINNRPVVAIGDRAFKYVDTLTRVAVPEGVTSIGKEAFAFSELYEVILPGSLKTMGNNAFEGCEYLESILIPLGLKTVPNYAFKDCTALKSIYFAKGVETIGFCAFEGCEALERLVLPESVKVVDSFAFSDCYELRYIYIPQGVTRIDEEAFVEVWSGDDTDAWTGELIAIYYGGSKEDWARVGNHSLPEKLIQFNHRHTFSVSNRKYGTFTQAGTADFTCKTCKTRYSEYYAPATGVSLAGTVYYRTGKAITPAVTVKTSSGNVLVQGKDYNVTYAAGRVKPGTYAVTVTLTGNYSGSKTLKFSIFEHATGVKLNKSSLTLGINDTYTLKATVAPSSAQQSVTYTSSDKSVATVSAKGVVKGVGGGKAAITATTADGVSAKCTVKIVDAKLNKYAVKLNIGQTYTLSVSGADRAVSSWKSSNKNVVTVSNGMLKGVAAGTATVSVKLKSGITLRCTVTVLKAYLNKTKLSVNCYDTKQLTLKNPSSSKIKWKSSNTRIATVSNKGAVTGVKPGKATITATCAGLKYTCAVTVKAVNPITFKQVDWFYDDYDEFTVTFSFHNNTNKFIKYLEIDLQFRNRYGDLIRGENEATVYTDSGIPAFETKNMYYEPDVYYDYTISRIDIDNVHVVYLDNTEETFYYGTYWYDSEYLA